MTVTTHDTARAAALSRAEIERVERIRDHGLRGAAGVPALIDMLDDPSWAVRRHVVSELAGLGDAAVDALALALETRRDSETRIAATADALATSLGDVEGAARRMANHADPMIAAEAAQILGRRRARSSVDVLARLSRHPDDNVAVAAIEGLGRVGGRTAVDTLIEAVNSGNFFRTFPAIDVLGRTGDPRAIAPLAELLAGSEYALEAARALGKAGDPAAVKPLAALLGRRSDALVRIATVALAELRQHYTERYGDTGAIEDELRRHLDPGVSRTVASALQGASTTERQAMCWLLGALSDESAIPVLASLLDAPSPVAREAGAALERISRAAAQQVTTALREGDSEQRRSLLPVVVSRLRHIEGVTACLEDPDPAVRASACDALVRIGDPRAVPQLFRLLGDPDLRVVQSATGAIQSLGSAETERLALDAARSGDAHTRRAALRILAYFGFRSALDLFLDAIAGPDARLRDAALQGLPFIDAPEAFDALLAATRHAEARVRATAMRALGNSTGGLQPKSYLLRGVTDEDPWVRYYAVQGLGRLRFHAAAEPIAAVLDDPAGQVRVAAVEALSQLDSPIADGILHEAASASDPDVRRAAILGLGIKRRHESLPLFRDAVRDSDAATRLVAVSALAGFSGPEALGWLEQAARDEDACVRTAAIGFLGARPTEEATAALVRLARDPDRVVEISDALSQYSPGRVAGLLSGLADADDELAPTLASALARMHQPEADGALLAALSTAGAAGRKAAAEALSVTMTGEAAEALQRAWSTDPDPAVRQVCGAALAR